jgi:hypothetical protein
MKRCSQCDFIYEDDQHLCDMDGYDLVYEPTLHPLQINSAIPAAQPPTRSVNSRVRRQMLAAAVAVLMATIISVGYSGLTSEYAPQNTKAPSTKVIRAPQFAPDQTPATPAVSPTPTPSQSPESDNTETPSNQVAPPASGYRSTVSQRETMRSPRTKANRKKESGISSFLKKTGNMLKKPFKKL